MTSPLRKDYKPWTPEEDSQLRRLINEGKTFEEIGKILGRSPKSVQKYKTHHKIRKARLAETGRKTLSQREKEKFSEWERKFRKSERYKKLQGILMPDELIRFMQDWIVYHIQVDDMLAAEEDQLENMLIIKLRMDDNQAALRMATEQEARLKEQFGGRLDQDLDPENEQDHMLYEHIMSVNQQKNELNKQFLALQASYQETQKHLNLSREQREKAKRVGADTFFSFVKSFNDRDIREKIGRQNELFKIATARKLQQLKEPHKFVDGTYRPIVMSGGDYLTGKNSDVPTTSPDTGHQQSVGHTPST